MEKRFKVGQFVTGWEHHTTEEDVFLGYVVGFILGVTPEGKYEVKWSSGTTSHESGDNIEYYPH